MAIDNPQLFTSDKKDWCTPAVILDRVYQVGNIALDPCNNVQSIVKAKASFHGAPIDIDGLVADWKKESCGLIFVNWPYGNRENRMWARKVVTEAAKGCEVIALAASRTSEAWLQSIILASKQLKAVGFVHKRLRFSNATSVAPFGSVLFYFGPRVDRFVAAFEDICWIIKNPRRGTYPIFVREAKPKIITKRGGGKRGRRAEKLSSELGTPAVSAASLNVVVRVPIAAAPTSIVRPVIKVPARAVA